MYTGNSLQPPTPEIPPEFPRCPFGMAWNEATQTCEGVGPVVYNGGGYLPPPPVAAELPWLVILGGVALLFFMARRR
jgi:hypothetical protein